MSAPDLLTFAAELEATAASHRVASRHRPPWAPTQRDRVLARQRDYERLEPVALTLAEKVGANGFTADNLRRAAVAAGVITGEEGKGPDGERHIAQRALSWFGPFLTTLVRRGLIAPLTYPDGQPVRRASDRPEAHGNLHKVYCLPAFSRARTREFSAPEGRAS